MGKEKIILVPAVVPEAPKKPVRTKPMRGSEQQVQENDSAKLNQGVIQTNTQLKMKEDFCTKMLVGGYVQSFVDMFYLTHRDEAQVMMGSGHDSLENGTLQLAEMEFLRDQLVTAEHAKRKGEVNEMLNAYEGLATYCMEKKDFKTMIFFYEKCLEIARIAKDQACEMRVLSKIGLGYHTLKELEKAREYQELHVALAQEILEEPFQRDAFIQLGKVYLDLANDLEKAPKLEESIQFYKKFLECSTSANDPESIGYGQFKIGSCYNALSQPAEALPFLQAYLVTCKSTSNVEGEGKACAELATTHEKLSNKQVSIDFLNQYLAIATRSENILNQADACRRLGHVFTAARDFSKAREMLEKNYELMTENLAFNSSRINLGVARANEKIFIFLNLVKNDLRGLLDWKSSRTVPLVE